MIQGYFPHNNRVLPILEEKGTPRVDGMVLPEQEGGSLDSPDQQQATPKEAQLNMEANLPNLT